MQQEHLVMVRNEYPYLPEQLSFLCLLLFPIPFPQLPLTRYLTGIKTHHPEELSAHGHKHTWKKLSPEWSPALTMMFHTNQGSLFLGIHHTYGFTCHFISCALSLAQRNM